MLCSTSEAQFTPNAFGALLYIGTKGNKKAGNTFKVPKVIISLLISGICRLWPGKYEFSQQIEGIGGSKLYIPHPVEPEI